jgi:hypothetical protein
MLVLASLALAGCEDSSTGPGGEGTIVVAVTTSGGDPDLDGYEVRLDGDIGVALSAIDEQNYVLAAGRHELELTGMAPNCTVGGGVTRSVTVTTGGNERVEFRVVCRATGFRVSATTFGVDRDLNGYEITVDGVTRGTVSANSQVLISRLAPGEHTVGLAGISPNCTLDGPPTRTLTVTNAALAPVAFALTCVATYGVVRIEVATAGPRRDDAITAESSPTPVFDPPLMAVIVTGTGLAYLTPVTGVQYIRLTDVASNCAVEGDNQREVNVTVGSTIRDTAVAHFDVTCTAGDATLRVTVAATGSEVPGEFTLKVSRLFNCDYYYGCSSAFFDEFPLASDGLTTIPLPSDHYQVALDQVSTCRWDGYVEIDLPTGGTQDVVFAVLCERPRVRVTAPTSGTNLDTQYVVTLWTTTWYYGTFPQFLGVLDAGGTLERQVDPDGYGSWIELGDVAPNCTVSTPNPTAPFYVGWGEVYEAVFPVTCWP